MTVTLLVTDRNLAVVGDPISGWTDLDVVGRYNEPASGSFTAPADAALMDQLQPGNRIVVHRDGAPFMSGPIEKPGPYVWDAAADGGGRGRITVHFADDLALVAGRRVYPDPTASAVAQTEAAYWTRSNVNAETILRDLVNLNAGPGALPARRVPRLTLGPVAGVGTAASVTARFDALGDALRSVALAGGGLGFRTAQVGPDIQFQVYAPNDRSRGIRFSRDLDNLRAVQYDPEAPAVTVALVAGQGQGTARNIREIADADAAARWWRLETFIDQRQTNVDAELDQAGWEALAENGEQGKLTTVTVDTPEQKFGRDYGLGDKVTVELYPGTDVADYVRGFHLQASPADGEVLTAVIGSQEATRDPYWLRVGRDLYRRIGQLERT